jgi:hypothetical protein
MRTPKAKLPERPARLSLKRVAAGKPPTAKSAERSAIASKRTADRKASIAKAPPDPSDPRGLSRSRVSNGSAILPGVNANHILARRFRDIIGQVIADSAGIDQCSEIRLQLIRRFAAAAVLAENLEAKMVNGAEISLSDHATLSSTLCRIASRLGIDRVSKSIVPTLSDYLSRPDPKNDGPAFIDDGDASCDDDAGSEDAQPDAIDLAPEKSSDGK